MEKTIEDVQIETKLNESKNKKRRLIEGKGFNVRDVDDMEKAEEFLPLLFKDSFLG